MDPEHESEVVAVAARTWNSIRGVRKVLDHLPWILFILGALLLLQKPVS